MEANSKISSKTQPVFKEDTKPRVNWNAILIIFSLLTIFAIAANDTRIKSLDQRIKDWAASLKKPEIITQTVRDQTIIDEESAVIEVVEKVSPAVVSVVAKEVGFDPFTGPYSEESGIGTGFIIDSKGLILTNSHVVDSEAAAYTVVLSDARSFPVKKVHLDRVNDLAILEIEASGLPVIEFGDSDALKVGQTAIAIGNALGKYSNSVTVGVVSGIARQVTAAGLYGQTKTFEDVIQTDAALNPGNSGGPMINLSGQVVGINVATTMGAENIGFAIPINNAKPVVEDFRKVGRIVRPFLGVEYVMITKDMASLRRLPEGAFIKSVVRDSAADKAGMEAGDIIVRFAGEDVSEDNLLSKIIQSKKVGETVEVEVDRKGEKLKLRATLEEAPGE